MGILKQITDEIVSDTVDSAESLLIAGTIKTAGAALKAGKAAVTFVGKTASATIDKRNTSLLKKENKKLKNCLYATKQAKLGEGIYTIAGKKGVQEYNSILTHDNYRDFILKLYDGENGTAVEFIKESTQKKLIRITENNPSYIAVYHGQRLGTVKQSREGKQKVYITDFNHWIATGEISEGNYIILDKESGKVLCTISKKYKSASTSAIICDDDDNRDLLIGLSILIDIIN